MSDRASIESLQTERLRALLTSLRAGNDFYRDRLAKVDLGNSPTLADFVAKMPFTTKMDLVWDREEFPPYGSNLTYPLRRYSRFCQSSGTTRGPLPTLDTTESWSAMLLPWLGERFMEP